MVLTLSLVSVLATSLHFGPAGLSAVAAGLGESSMGLGEVSAGAGRAGGGAGGSSGSMGRVAGRGSGSSAFKLLLENCQ